MTQQGLLGSYCITAKIKYTSKQAKTNTAHFYIQNWGNVATLQDTTILFFISLLIDTKDKRRKCATMASLLAMNSLRLT